MNFPFLLPRTGSAPEPPSWTGRGFQVNGSLEPVLCYATEESGWTDELTTFHEDLAGDSHYMDRASRANAISRLQRWVKAPAPVIMDIGCSSGYLLRDIRQALPSSYAIGADYVLGPLRELAAKYPAWPLLQFDLTRSPLPDACLDAAVLLNVLEHVEDDTAAVRHVHRMLKPGGVAVIEVPAGPHLYDVYDKQLLHHRRYTRAGVNRLLEKAGFEVMESSHLGVFLYPAFAAVKLRNRKHLSLPDAEQRKLVAQNISLAMDSPLLHLLMRTEAALRYRVPYPAGIRVVTVGRKRS